MVKPLSKRGIIEGRPSKITKFTEAVEKVLYSDQNAIIMTDEELIMLINEELEKKDRICQTSFEDWKRQAKKGEVKDERLTRFLGVYKKALGIQKKELFNSLKTDDKVWQRWAWIIERKFDDWNIRLKTEITGKDGKDLIPTPILGDVQKDNSNK